MNAPPSNARHARERALAAQWLGVLLGPLAWGAHLSLVYFLASVACGPGLAPWLYGATAAALLAVAAGGWLAARNRRLLAGDEDEREAARSRFLATMGLFSSLLFGLGIIAQTVPVGLEAPC